MVPLCTSPYGSSKSSIVVLTISFNAACEIRFIAWCTPATNKAIA